MNTELLEQKRRRSGEQAGSDPPRPNRTIFVFLFVIPIVMTLAYGGTDTWALIILFPMIAVLGTIWLVRSWRKRELELSFDSIQLPLIGLFLLGLIQLLPFGDASVAAGSISITASRALSQDPYATRIFLLRLFCYTIFFAAALTFIDTKDRLRKAVTAIVVFGSVLAFTGILQKLASPDAIYGIRKTPQAIPFGPYVNQHHFASLMVLLSGIAVGHIFGNAVSKQVKLLLGLAALVMGIAVPLTSSRGGVISYIAMLGVASLVLLYRRDETSERRTWLLAFAGLIGFGVLAIGTVIFLGGAESLLRGVGFQNTTDDISSGRLHFWSVAWQIFVANPIVGAGFDAFAVAYTQFDTRNGMYRVEQAHNDYLQALADSGLIGFACVVAFVVLFVRKVFARIADSIDTFQRVTVIGAFAGCVGIMVHSFFDFPLRTAGNAFFFLLIVALAVTQLREET